MDIIVSILALITGTEDGGNETPRCFYDYVGSEIAVVDCVSMPDAPNPYYIDENGKLTLTFYV